VLNDKINEISLQQYASFSVPTQIYYWDLHVSSFKKISIFGNSDRHIHLLIRILLSNQVELNPGPQSLDDSNYPCSLFVPKNVHGILMQLHVTTVTNGVLLYALTQVHPCAKNMEMLQFFGFAQYVIHQTILEQYFNHTYPQGIHFFVQTHITC
jgi:hypothetical protein